MTSPASNISVNIYCLPLEEAYSQLDAEISSLQERLCYLRTLRNSLPPISKIPIELLSKIFFHTQEHNGLPFRDHMDISTRFYVSWVCRQWRETALVIPNLWTVVSKRSKEVVIPIEFAQTMLARSRNLPLTVGLFKPSMEVLAACLSQMSRIQHLRLFSAPQSIELKNLLDQPAPLLLLLDCEYRFSSHAFSGVHPQLRYLTLTATHILRTSSLISSTLTSLRIIKPSWPFDADHLVDILIALPHLTEVVLWDCFQHEVVVPPPQPVSRPSLQTVSITGWDLPTVFGFLQCFNIPQAAITLTWPEATSIGREAFLDCSTQFSTYQNQLGFDIRHMKIGFSVRSIQLDVGSAPTQHRYFLRFPNQRAGHNELDAMLTAIQFEHLQTFSADILTPDIVNKLEDLDSLKSVRFSGNQPLQEFAPRFNLSLDPDTHTPEVPIRFPAIEELALCEMDNQYESEVDDLLAALETRRSLGFTLQSLVLTKCPDLDPQLVFFREVVDHLSVFA